MTIEEHQEHLLSIMDSMPDDACGDWRDSLAYAIDIMHKYQKLQADYENCLKADLTPILGKIRAEIDHDMREAPYMYDDEHLDELYGYQDGLERTLNIIDKYRGKKSALNKMAESEEVSVLDKIRAEIREWYWQVDKQTLAKDPCVVDAMVDLFIRTINKYKPESEEV